MTDRETNTLASRGLEEPFFPVVLLCHVSFWFWREIEFGCTYYYVLGVPYSCGVVLVFLSSVWWVRNHYYDRKKNPPAHAQQVYLSLCLSSVFCTLIHMWRCLINCSYYSYVKKIKKTLIRICEFEFSFSNTGQRFF